jgi:hypothetical protein
MDERERPEDGDQYWWESFDLWADENGYGTYTEDWEDASKTWKAAIDTERQTVPRR